MNSNEFALVIAVVLAAIMFVMYILARVSEHGINPHYAREVYRVEVSPVDADAALRVARQYGASVATRAHVAAHVQLGGSAQGGALADDHGAPVAGAPFPSGVWLYGPKPQRGTPTINPFNGSHWFQPET
jgi:hypothetical protein